MSFSIIACIGQNNELGKNGQLIWHLPSDMKFFKAKTTGHKIVMGRKTWQSLPGKLPERQHYVITSNPNLQASEINIISDINQFITESQSENEEIFIIGGASIYSAFLPHVETMYLTQVSASDPEADTFFPNFNKREWQISELEKHHEKDLDYTIKQYKRRKDGQGSF